MWISIIQTTYIMKITNDDIIKVIHGSEEEEEIKDPRFTRVADQELS